MKKKFFIRFVCVFLSLLLFVFSSFPVLAANDLIHDWHFIAVEVGFGDDPSTVVSILGQPDNPQINEWFYGLFEDVLNRIDKIGSRTLVYNLIRDVASVYTFEGHVYPCFYWTGFRYNVNAGQSYTTLTSFENLADLAFVLNQAGFSTKLVSWNFTSYTGRTITYWCICCYNGGLNNAIGEDSEVQSSKFFLSDSNGKVWVAPTDDGTSSTSQDFKYYTIPSSTETVNNTTTNIVDQGQTVNIDNPVIRFAGDKYDQDYFYDYRTGEFVETDRIEYNIDDRDYDIYVDNRSYAYYTYYITNTNITYIGNNETFDVYELYYQLPDGRSSADLTSEDLETIALNFDVINYSKSTDDTRLRALYQFDGNTDNSAYFDSSLVWNSGASITYFDVTNFGGALYLDEAAHSFTINLPATLSNRDFSILFRYYHTATPQGDGNRTDLTITSNNVTLTTILSGESTSSVPVPVGTWSEIALIRVGTTLYFYVNGLSRSAVVLSSSLDSSLTFSFAAANITRQIDELRVYSFAYVDGGVSYSPTSVPVDSNNILILPDEATPVPDPYWTFNTTGNLLNVYDYTEGYNYYLQPYASNSTQGYYYINNFSSYRTGSFLSPPSMVSVLDSSVKFAPSVYYSSYPSVDVSGSGDYRYICFNPSIYIASRHYNGSTFGVSLQNGNYVFSVVGIDGVTYSVPFTFNGFGSVFESSVDFDWGTLFVSLRLGRPGNNWSAYASVLSASFVCSDDFEIVYAELVRGSTANTGHQHVTEIYSDLDITGPTIAVRSFIPVRSPRLGGVRPSIPFRGDVWFQIENEYITSCQIYTGLLWQEVDCRIWTGSRWVWSTFFNVKTLQDFTDMHGTSDNPHIQTQQGFYDWLYSSFQDLLTVLREIKSGISEIDSGGGSTVDIDLGFDVDLGDLSFDGTSSLLSVFGDLWSIFFFGEGDPVPIGTVSNDVFVNFDNFSSVFTSEQFSSGDDSDYGVFSIFTYEGDDLWE